MTFSVKVKNELCKASSESKGTLLPLLYGVLLFSRSFKAENIRFHTENKSICGLVSELLAREFGCIVDVLSSGKDKQSIMLRVPYQADREKILGALGHAKDEISLKINNDLLRTSGDIKLFLRGVFLSCGTVTDPQNGYHLEFAVPFLNLSKSLCDLLNALTDIKIKAKTTERKGIFVVYIKDSADITDFLAYVGAPASAMDMMQVKMVKEVRNYVNRTTNFEAANLSKIATAAALQIDAIKMIKASGKFSCLDDDLQELATLRLSNPEMSLRELGKNLSVPLTRSGVNHKMKKILTLSESL